MANAAGTTFSHVGVSAIVSRHAGAPHARPDLQLLCKRLLHALGRNTGAHRVLGELLEKVRNVLTVMSRGTGDVVWPERGTERKMVASA